MNSEKTGIDFFGLINKSPDSAGKKQHENPSMAGAASRYPVVGHGHSPGHSSGAYPGGLEEQMQSPITMAQKQQAADRAYRVETERLGKAAISRLEAKVRSVEAQQLRADRRLAELSGLVQGLSEEQRSQLHRLDRVEEKQRGEKRGVDDEWRRRFGDLEREQQAIALNFRLVSSVAEESQKRQYQRVRHLEGSLEDRLRALEERTSPAKEDGSGVDGPPSSSSASETFSQALKKETERVHSRCDALQEALEQQAKLSELRVEQALSKAVANSPAVVGAKLSEASRSSGSDEKKNDLSPLRHDEIKREVGFMQERLGKQYDETRTIIQRVEAMERDRRAERNMTWTTPNEEFAQQKRLIEALERRVDSMELRGIGSEARPPKPESPTGQGTAIVALRKVVDSQGDAVKELQERVVHLTQGISGALVGTGEGTAGNSESLAVAIENLEQQFHCSIGELRGQCQALQEGVDQNVMPSVWQLQHKLPEAIEKVDFLKMEVQDISSKVEEHDVRIDMVRTKLDAHDQRFMVTTDKVERLPTWEQVRATVREEQRKLPSREDFDMLSQKVDSQTKAGDELQDRVQDLHHGQRKLANSMGWAQQLCAEFSDIPEGSNTGDGTL
eukprot:gnl/MRDRNA2_/MRDRNA2_103396_c0_seq1.p1 gnl/MRDRNA2_/MRDRNA2_103396_c0~~gnl/MRDRNA2_/MRDRNA2_103396_c0_seq1.p1  ORF type:complete len:617 (+),score=168.72 gnl/MRDRNA2_/MRDRNA2_103396_c0_seq1:76-1926(+)